RRPPEVRVPVDLVPFTERRGAFHDGVRAEPRARAQPHVRADDGVGADLAIGVHLRGRIHDGRPVDRHHAAPGRSTTLLRISASAQSWPSTRASAFTFTSLWRCERSSTVMTSWSPGTTGRRKRALSTPAR